MVFYSVFLMVGSWDRMWVGCSARVKVDEWALTTEQNLVSMMARSLVTDLDKKWGDELDAAMAIHLDDSTVEMKEGWTVGLTEYVTVYSMAAMMVCEMAVMLVHAWDEWKVVG